MSQEDRLRTMSDDELAVVVAELQARAEEFDSKARSLVNDELRRRKMPLVGFGRSRH
jgi:hypothetical protein